MRFSSSIEKMFKIVNLAKVLEDKMPDRAVIYELISKTVMCYIRVKCMVGSH